MHRSYCSIKAVGGASSRDVACLTGGRGSLADVDGHSEVGSAAVVMNQGASDSSLTYASTNNA